jgi:hypothetical protein
MEITLDIRNVEDVVGPIIAEDLKRITADKEWAAEEGMVEIVSALRVALEYYVGPDY